MKMKKNNLLILAVAALGFAACANDETTAVNEKLAESNEISFRTLVGGQMRSTAGPMAGGTNFQTGDKINVYAGFTPSGGSEAKYFQDRFTKQDGDAGFTSVAKHYWPAFASGDKMTFVAIYSDDDLGSKISTSTVGMIDDYSPATAAASQIDVMVAKKEVIAKETKVLLNFRHALSQIVVNVKNTNAALDFDITGVRIGYVSTTGDFTYSGGVTNTQEESGHISAAQTLVAANNWTPAAVADANTNKYDQASTGTITSIQSATALTSFNSWLLIPQTQTAANAYAAATKGTAASNPTLNGSYIALKLAIYNYNGSARSSQLVSEQWCYWPCNFTWNPGYKYTYTVDLAGGGYQPINTESASTDLDPVLGDVIVFSPECTVDYWVTPADIDVPAAPAP